MKKILFTLMFFMLSIISIDASPVYNVNKDLIRKNNIDVILMYNDSLLIHRQDNFEFIYKYLDLDNKYYDSFYNIHKDLSNSINYLEDNKEEGVKYFKHHIKYDLRNCYFLFDENQYRKYSTLINITLHSRGLMIYIIESEIN